VVAEAIRVNETHFRIAQKRPKTAAVECVENRNKSRFSKLKRARVLSGELPHAVDKLNKHGRTLLVIGFARTVPDALRAMI
jgi:hypothetical protein